MLHRTALLLFRCALLMLPVATATAASIEVAPVVVTMQPGQQATTLTVTNRGNEPAAAQLRGFSWNQTTTNESLTPTEALLVSPPVFQLPPGASQVVRVVLRPAAGGGERTFRILLDELPPPATPGSGIRMALRLSLPVFVPSPAAPPPSLGFRLLPGGKLSVTNRGGRHERLSDLRLTAADGSTVPLQPPTTPYVLVGAERHWTLARPVGAGSALKLTGQSTAGPFQESLAPPTR